MTTRKAGRTEVARPTDRAPALQAAPPAAPPEPSPGAQRTWSSRGASPAALPDWYPPGNWNLDTAAEGARRILSAQGKPPAEERPKHIVFTDADLTFLKATVGERRRDAEGKLVMNPETGKPVLLKIGGGVAHGDNLEELQRRHPEMPQGPLTVDTALYDDPKAVLKTKPIPETLRVLQKSNRTPGNEEYVITARWDEKIVGAMDTYLKKRDVDVEGVFISNSPGHSKLLGFTPELTGAQRKALTMAAMLKLRDPQSATVRKVTYMEDNDQNMQAAMDLLPKLFPKMKFDFVDVVHVGDGKFERRPIAHSQGNGPTLYDGRGKEFGEDAIKHYRSNDDRWEPRPEARAQWKRG